MKIVISTAYLFFQLIVLEKIGGTGLSEKCYSMMVAGAIENTPMMVREL